MSYTVTIAVDDKLLDGKATIHGWMYIKNNNDNSPVMLFSFNQNSGLFNEPVVFDKHIDSTRAHNTLTFQVEDATGENMVSKINYTKLESENGKILYNVVGIGTKKHEGHNCITSMDSILKSGGINFLHGAISPKEISRRINYLK